MADRSDAKRKELETRRRLGPRLPKPETVRRVTAEQPQPFVRRGRFPRAGRAHPTRDSPA